MGKAFDHYLESLATNKGSGNTSVKMLLVCDHARSPSVSLLNSTSVLNDDDDSNYPFLVCRSREEGDLYESGSSTTSTSAGVLVRAGAMGAILDTRWETSTNDHPPSVDGLHSTPKIRRKRDSPNNRQKQEQRNTSPRKLPPHSPQPRKTSKTLSTLPESLRTQLYKDCVDPVHTRTRPPSSAFPLTLVADILAKAAQDAIPPSPPPGPISSPPTPSSSRSHHSRHSHHSVPSSPRPRRKYVPSSPIFGTPNSSCRKKTIEVDQLRKKCSDSLHLTF
jgi:hypothetical protein